MSIFPYAYFVIGGWILVYTITSSLLAVYFITSSKTVEINIRKCTMYVSILILIVIVMTLALGVIALYNWFQSF